MDFENAQFYKQAYDVTVVWSAGTVVGFASSCLGVAFAVGWWNKDSGLWKAEEGWKSSGSGDLEMDARCVT